MDKPKEYKGKLLLHWETGCEDVYGAFFQDYRGIRPNPDYDPESKHIEHHTPEFYDWDWTIEFHTGDYLEVYNPDGSIAFQGVIIKNRRAWLEFDERLSFVPREIPPKTWFKWLIKEYKAKLIKNYKQYLTDNPNN